MDKRFHIEVPSVAGVISLVPASRASISSLSLSILILVINLLVLALIIIS